MATWSISVSMEQLYFALRRGGGRADGRPTPASDQLRGDHGVAPRVLEGDVGLVTGQVPDPPPEAAPIRRVLVALGLADAVVLRRAVDDVLDAELVHQRHLLRR